MFAGRDILEQRVARAIARSRAGIAARAIAICGLRGMGKTVILDRIRLQASAAGVVCARISASAARPLAPTIARALNVALLQWSIQRAPSDASEALSSTDQVLNVVRPGRRDASSGEEQETALSDALTRAGTCCAGWGASLALFIDDLHQTSSDDLGTLLHAYRSVVEQGKPVFLIVTGSPQFERDSHRTWPDAAQLEFIHLEALDLRAAFTALYVPFQREQVAVTNEAVTEILLVAQGCPYFIQALGWALWDLAQEAPITREVGAHASILGLAELDASFLGPQFDRATTVERRYLEAMAKLGSGLHRSGDIARALGMAVTAAAPVRASLIAKALVYSPSRGETAFTTPGFDGFIKRNLAAAAGGRHGG